MHTLEAFRHTAWFPFFCFHPPPPKEMKFLSLPVPQTLMVVAYLQLRDANGARCVNQEFAQEQDHNAFLLLDFLKYFGTQFDYRRFGICVRLSKPLLQGNLEKFRLDQANAFKAAGIKRENEGKSAEDKWNICILRALQSAIQQLRKEQRGQKIIVEALPTIFPLTPLICHEAGLHLPSSTLVKLGHFSFAFSFASVAHCIAGHIRNLSVFL